MSHAGAAANWVTQPLFASWTLDPWVAMPLALAAGISLRGWWQLHRRLPRRFEVWRLIAFQDGKTREHFCGRYLSAPIYRVMNR